MTIARRYERWMFGVIYWLDKTLQTRLKRFINGLCTLYFNAMVTY